MCCFIFVLYYLCRFYGRIICETKIIAFGVKSLLAVERRNQIVEMVHLNNKVLVAELSKQFKVTEETIRRDLEKLEREGVVTRTYGGAMLNRHINEDVPFTTRHATNIDIKRDIALKAIKLINDGETLMVDPSTTAMEFIKMLGNKKELTIITSSVNILLEPVISHYNVISTGGSLRPQSLSLIGPTAQETVQKYNADTAIISCKALAIGSGIMDSNEIECELKKLMIKQAERIILLADHTKFDRKAFVKLADWNVIDYLITNTKPSEVWLNLFAEHHIEVIYE